MLKDSLNLMRSQYLGLSRVLSTISQLVNEAVESDGELPLLQSATDMLIQNHNLQYVTIHIPKEDKLELVSARSINSLLRPDIDESEEPWVKTCEVIASQHLNRSDTGVIMREVANTHYYSSPLYANGMTLGMITVNSPQLDESHSKFLPVFSSTLASLVLSSRYSAQLNKEVARRSVELETAWAVANQSREAKSRFLSNLSHEYLTPLNAIETASHLLADSGLSPEQLECVGIIQNAAKNLNSMVGGTLDYVQNQDEQDGQITATNLRPWLESIISELPHQDSLDIRLVTPMALPAVEIDEKRLKKILSHLLGNATKFSERGFIELEATVLSTKPKAVEIEFAVKDTGIGIDRVQQDNIFTAFHQLNNSSTRRYGGTGLGLALCQQLAQVMGTKIRVESEVGKGSRFSLVLTAPLSNGRAQTAMLAENDNLNILLVEDNLINQKLAARLLEKMGCQVDIANDGVDAVDKFSQSSYDLVFMDCQMPNMDGFEATSRIRNLESGHRTPIIALTANSLPEDRARSFKVGMDEFLTKPVAKQKLKDALTRWGPG